MPKFRLPKQLSLAHIKSKSTIDPRIRFTRPKNQKNTGTHAHTYTKSRLNESANDDVAEDEYMISLQSVTEEHTTADVNFYKLCFIVRFHMPYIFKYI